MVAHFCNEMYTKIVLFQLQKGLCWESPWLSLTAFSTTKEAHLYSMTLKILGKHKVLLTTRYFRNY